MVQKKDWVKDYTVVRSVFSNTGFTALNHTKLLCVNSMFRIA